jgi:hypothetical protein
MKVERSGGELAHKIVRRVAEARGDAHAAECRMPAA